MSVASISSKFNDFCNAASSVGVKSVMWLKGASASIASGAQNVAASAARVARVSYNALSNATSHVATSAKSLTNSTVSLLKEHPMVAGGIITVTLIGIALIIVRLVSEKQAAANV